MTATRQFSTKRARGSRLAKPSEGSPGLPRFLGKTAGVTPLLPSRLVLRVLLYIGRIGARGGGFWNLQRFQKLLGGQNGTAGPAGRVLDLAVRAHHDGAVSELTREPHQLVVRRRGRAREDHANAASRRRRAA